MKQPIRLLDRETEKPFIESVSRSIVARGFRSPVETASRGLPTIARPIIIPYALQGNERPARHGARFITPLPFQREALNRGVSTMTVSSTGDRATRLLIIAFAILLVNSSYLAA